MWSQVHIYFKVIFNQRPEWRKSYKVSVIETLIFFHAFLKSIPQKGGRSRKLQKARGDLCLNLSKNNFL